MLLTGRSLELGLMTLTIQVARGSVDFASYCHGSETCNQMKFQLSGPPAELAPFEKKTSVEGCGGVLPAAVFFSSSLWLEKRRPGGHRHGFWTIVWRIPYPILNQWVTSFFHPNLKMKFQLSPASGCAGSYMKETMGSLSYDPR